MKKNNIDTVLDYNITKVYDEGFGHGYQKGKKEGEQIGYLRCQEEYEKKIQKCLDRFKGNKIDNEDGMLEEMCGREND